MRRPRRATPSRRQLALAAAAQAPLRVDPDLRARLTTVADDLSRWIDTEAGERRSPDGDDGEG